MYKEIFDKIAQYFSAGKYETEYRETRQRYLNLIGSFGEDELLFENQMTRFLEWYLLDRELLQSAIPPCRLYRLSYQHELTPAFQDILYAFEQSTHSLFQVHAVDGQGTVVKDLLNRNAEHRLEKQFYPEFRIADLIDARLFTLNDINYLTESAWMYPSEMKNSLLETVKKYDGKNKSKFLMDLAYMKSKRDRFPHVPIEQIFQWEQMENDRENYLRTKSVGTP